MRRRLFAWLVVVFAAGLGVGVYLWDQPRWWYFVIAFFGLSIVSGMVAFRLTRPLLMVVRAARDIGDGKLDRRLPLGRGEMRILAMSINDMADKIQQQLKDQRQLLAAVSHELRTPLGHMRVLVETARETKDTKAMDEPDREISVLAD